MATYTELILCVMVSVVCFAQDEPEGSGDVCNVDGPTCPNDKCCRESNCLKDSPELKCCNDPSKDPDRSNPECSNCPKCVDCEWKPWITETVNGYTRECKKLKCTKDGKEPERAAGKRDRRILREAGPGGRQCRGRSLQDCEGDCPEHCTWNTWTPYTWTNAAQSCGTGSRTRRIIIEAKYGGIQCTGRSRDSTTKACK